MKKIIFVSGSNAYNRISFIKQKGFVPIVFEGSFEGAKLNRSFLSVEDALHKSSEVFIVIDHLTSESLKQFSNIINKFSVETSSIYLIDAVKDEDFDKNERDFSLFMKLPHNKIFFDFFSSK